MTQSEKYILEMFFLVIRCIAICVFLIYLQLQANPEDVENNGEIGEFSPHKIWHISYITGYKWM